MENFESTLRGKICKQLTGTYMYCIICMFNLTHWLLCRLVTAGTSLGFSSTSDVVSFDQNWHHLYSIAAGGKDPSNNTQIRVIGLMAPVICTKMFKTLSEKLRAKFPATTHGYSAKNCQSQWHFLRSFLTASKFSSRSIKIYGGSELHVQNRLLAACFSFDI